MNKRGRAGRPVFVSRDTLLDAHADGELGLHGYGVTETPSAVRNFLESWQRRRAGAVVHIITGKGKGSSNGPVLRGLVRGLLQGELRSMVAEFGLNHGEGGYKAKLR